MPLVDSRRERTFSQRFTAVVRRIALTAAIIVLSLVELGAVFRPAREVNGEPQLIEGKLDGCRAHVVMRDSPLSEKTYPCGEVVTLPAGRFLAWLEMGDLMSPWPAFGNSSGEASGLTVGMPVDHAGFVTVVRPDISSDEDDAHVRLFSVSHRGEIGYNRRTFRRVVSLYRDDVVRMPAGIVLGGVFRANGDVIALSRPVEVDWKETVAIAPATPDASSDLFVELTHAKLFKDGELASPRLELTTDGEEPRTPDLVIARIDGIRAVWYDVSWRRATVSCALATLYLPPAEVRLTPGNVTTLRGELRAKPAIDVRLDAPPDAFDGEAITLRVHSSTASVLHEQMIEPGTQTRIESMPAEALSVRISAGRWLMARKADLSAGEDAAVDFDVRPIVVTGVVERGDEPVAGARLEWLVNRDDPLKIEADDDGRYRVTLWRPGLTPVLIRARAADDDSVPPFFETIEVDESTTKDFHLPDTRITILVQDAATGKPLPGATLAIGNEWDGEPGSLSTSSLRAITNAEGRAESPPLREGTMSIYARAEGYRDAEPIERPVPPEGEPVELVVRLEPEGEAAGLRVALSDGRPAGGAEAWIVDAGSGQPLWQGAATADGVLKVPRRFSSQTLVVRHVEAASHVGRMADVGGDLALRPAAPPLRIRVVDAEGAPARWALMCIVSPTARHLGGELAFMTWTRGASDRSGVWEARGLPSQSVRVFAWSGKAHEIASAGGYDAFAKEIGFPWPDDVTLEIVK